MPQFACSVPIPSCCPVGLTDVTGLVAKGFINGLYLTERSQALTLPRPAPQKRGFSELTSLTWSSDGPGTQQLPSALKCPVASFCGAGDRSVYFSRLFVDTLVLIAVTA